MSQINYKSKYLKYKAKYFFITNNQMDQEFKSSLNLLKGGAAGSVEEQQIKQLQELETKYKKDLLQLNTDKEKYINDLKETNFFATDNSLDIPTSETYNYHYNYNNNDKKKLDEQYNQDKQKILEKIQLLKSPVLPTVTQTSTPPI